MTLGVKPRRGLAAAIDAELRQLDHLDGAGAVGQPADEAALFQRGDQAVDARFRAQIERVLHFVEGGRHPGLLQPFVDEPQQFELLAREHATGPSVGLRTAARNALAASSLEWCGTNSENKS